jgi:phosphoribosylformylglycinamidine synthase PurS subunit
MWCVVVCRDDPNETESVPVEFEVLVQLKSEVLDPEGRAIQESLKLQGVTGVVAVTVAKRYLIQLEPTCKNPDATVHDIASRYLANPVAQVFQIKRLKP